MLTWRSSVVLGKPLCDTPSRQKPSTILPKAERHSAWYPPCLHLLLPKLERPKEGIDSAELLCTSSTSIFSGPLTMSSRAWVSLATHLVVSPPLGDTPAIVTQHAIWQASFRTNVHYKISLSPYFFPLLVNDCKVFYKRRLISYLKALDGSIEKVVACFDTLPSFIAKLDY